MEMKPCPECGQPMPANHRNRVTCSLRCRNRCTSRRLKGKPVPPQAHAAIAKRQKARVEAVTRHDFGEMTKREIAIFNRGVKHGYGQGYGRFQREEEAA